MGKPAARTTDKALTCNDPVDLPVGTVIATGTVLINSLPAAKQGDKIIAVDTHIIMVPSPGGPVPTPIPHPFMGTIDGGLSSSVKIMGQPAATVNSTATNTPSHIPQGGPFQKPPSNKGEIMMGSPNVLIGNGGGGSGSGSGGEGEAEVETTSVEAKEGHYLDAKFVDKGGKPITGLKYSIKTPDNKQVEGTLTGQIKKGGLEEGDHEISLMTITKAAWSAREARNGEKVKMQTETVGFDDGEKVKFEVWERDINQADKKIAAKSDIELSGGKAEAEWKYNWPEEDADTRNLQDKLDRYYAPKFYFTVKVGPCQARSAILEYKDYIEITFKDEYGKPAKNAKYRVFLPNGEIREGTLNDNGYAKVENVPPGPWDVEFPESDSDLKRA